MTIAAKTKPADISKLAQEIQQQADTARHLAITVSQALCDLHSCDDCQQKRKDDEERMFLFTNLIEEVSKKIGAIALQVEEADFKQHFAAAPSGKEAA